MTAAEAVGHGWVEGAACRGMDTAIFFPHPTESAMPAKRVCRVCPVRRECLLDALDRPAHSDVGVYGGLREEERRKLRKELGIKVPSRPIGHGAVAQERKARRAS